MCKNKSMYLPIIILLFITCWLHESQSLSSSTRSQSCLPQDCDGLIIKKPFWIPGLQESRCGSPGFNITCIHDKPVIKINGDDFIIRDIFYKNDSFLLSEGILFDDDSNSSCPIPKRNFSIDGSPFSYGPATADLFFFYNCTAPYDRETYPIYCASNAGHHSFAVFHPELLTHWKYPIESCQGPVNAAVEADGLNKLLKMNYTDILKKGFVLQWNGGDKGSQLNLDRKIGIGIGAAAFSIIIMCIIFYIYHRRYKKRYHSSSISYGSSSDCLSLIKDLEKAGVHIFEYHELEQATDHFNPKRELGDGGYGAVYKGKLQDGRVVAVKKLYEHHFKRVEQFINEIQLLTKLKHQNLVSLYGCASRYSRDLLLVYEYIPNGTLADHLHGPRSKPGNLSWIARLNIAIETASALAYLHASDVVHRDIKSSNILLDNNFTVKVADFGLSRLLPADATHVSTGPQGTPGYVDPEYNEFYQLTEKSDVYSFGVVLIELISSMPALDITRPRNEINLSTLAVCKIQNHALGEIVDPNLGFGSDYKVRAMIVAVAEVAFQCLQNRREMRPHMEDVLSDLQEIQSRNYSGDVVDVPADDIILLKNNSTPDSNASAS